MITVRADHGGGPEHIRQLVGQLADEFEISIASPKEHPYWDRYAALLGGDSLVEVPHRSFSLRCLLRLGRFVREKRIHLIHSHGKGAGIYGRLLGVFTGRICVHTFHGVHIGAYGAVKKRLYIALERLLARFTARIIAVSKGEFDRIVALGISSPGKIAVIENGVTPRNRGRYDVFSRSKLDVLTVSRFDYAKNTSLLIPIMEALRDAHQLDRFRFHIVGDGEGRREVEAGLQSAGLSEHTVFHGTLDDMDPVYSTAFCYLSTSRWEGMPLTVLESMSYGIPVIATDVVGNRDVVEDGVNGLLFDIDRPESAARMIEFLSKERALWRRMSRAGAKIAAVRFSSRRMGEETSRLYRELLGVRREIL